MSKAAQIAKVIRGRVMTRVRNHAGLRVAVALSGGVDSCSILAALLANRMDPLVVSYTPAGRESTDFVMARDAAKKFDLDFAPAIVDMSPSALEDYARDIIDLGYHQKVQVECLAPLITIHRTAREAGALVVFTGDQADGFFALSKWASHNADRAAGIPRGERTNVQQDTTSDRIDYLRRRYWELDKSCSEGVKLLGRQRGVEVVVPYRDEVIAKAFVGSLWSEVNKPRLKEPIRLAFEEWLCDIPTRKLPVNLHKGDSEFAVTMGKTLLAQPHLQGPWKSPTGLYAAMARGEV